MILGLVAWSMGCVTVDETDALTLEADGVSVVQGRFDEGDLDYIGSKGEDTFDIGVRAFGGGSSQERAEERLASVEWSAEVDRDVLELRVRAGRGRAGADFDIRGPDLVDLDVVTEEGLIRVDDVVGVHVLRGTSVRGALVGDVDIVASSTVDIDFVPFEETDTVIDGFGGVRLALPIRLDYDLTIRTDGTGEIRVDELGFDDVRTDVGFFNGLRGSGAIEIDIRSDGDVTILGYR